MAVFERIKKIPRLPAQLHISIAPETRVKLLRALIVVGVLALAYLMGGAGAGSLLSMGVVALVALVLLVVVMLFFSSHMVWGLPVMMITALFTPFSIPTGTESRIPDSMVVAAIFFVLWILRMVIVERRIHLTKTLSNFPLLAFIVVTAISLVWSMVFRDRGVVIWGSFPLVQLGMAAVMILLPATFLLVANFGNRPRILKLLTWLVIVAGPVGLVSNFTGTTLPVNLGGLFAMWVMTLSLALAFFQPGLGWLLRGLLFAQVGGWVLWSFVFHISWVAGWLPGMFAAAILVIIRSRKLFMVGLLVVLIVAVVFNGYFMERLAMERAESGDSRLSAWRVNWRVTGEHLIFGTGPGGYAAYYMTYFPNEGMATHNNYVDVIAQTGIVGLLLWLWFFGITAWQGFRLMLRLHGRRDFYEALSNAAFAGTVACIVIMMFGDWLLPFAYTQTIGGFDHAIYSWIFMGTIVAIDQIVPEAAVVVKNP